VKASGPRLPGHQGRDVRLTVADVARFGGPCQAALRSSRRPLSATTTDGALSNPSSPPTPPSRCTGRCDLGAIDRPIYSGFSTCSPRTRDFRRLSTRKSVQREATGDPDRARCQPQHPSKGGDRDGLGLGPFTVDVHAAQWGTLPRLIAAVDSGAVEHGVAIDENTAVNVDGTRRRWPGSDGCTRYALMARRCFSVHTAAPTDSVWPVAGR
jgi:hypothetical protein